MKRSLFVLILGALGLPAAAQDFACFQDCARRGLDRNQCTAMCERGLGSPYGQPGMSPNAGAGQDPRYRQPGMAPQQDPQFNVNQACFENCREDGNDVRQCQQQCRY